MSGRVSANDRAPARSGDASGVEVVMPRGYYVRVGWIVPDKQGDYRRKSKAMTIHATNLREACEIALARQANFICVAVEAAWFEWPQLLPMKEKV